MGGLVYIDVSSVGCPFWALGSMWWMNGSCICECIECTVTCIVLLGYKLGSKIIHKVSHREGVRASSSLCHNLNSTRLKDKVPTWTRPSTENSSECYVGVLSNAPLALFTKPHILSNKPGILLPRPSVLSNAPPRHYPITPISYPTTPAHCTLGSMCYPMCYPPPGLFTKPHVLPNEPCTLFTSPDVTPVILPYREHGRDTGDGCRWFGKMSTIHE